MGLPKPRSWKEAVVRWGKEKAGKVTIDDDVRKFDWLHAHLGSVRDINTIGREFVDSIMQCRGVCASNPDPRNATANRYVALIAGVLNAAEKEWGWGTRAPTLKRYQEPESNGRCLTPQEWWSLWKELPKHLRLAATFAISTGLREARVFGLRWECLSQDRSLSFVGKANKIGNSIPMNATSLRVLQECRLMSVVSPEYVFLYQGQPMKEHGQASFKKAVERAGIGHVMWKDFRTTFNSWLAQRGVPREIRARLMGHTTKEVQDRYTRLYVEHLRPFSEIIDSVLAQSTGQQSEKAL
jgi:integrase